VPAEAVLSEPAQRETPSPQGETVAETPPREEGSTVEKKRDYDTYGIAGKVPELAVVRARAVWLEVVDGVRGSPSALMERIDALTDPERVDEANMLAGWRAKYENEITASMKSRWWRRLARKRDVG